MDHLNFIKTTDRKSLYTQIKGLVAKAKEVANDELQQRRSSLHRLLEHEDKIYEEEFANKVKSRIDEDIKERKESLLKIKEANERSDREFLKSKRIQQYMNNCYEIREALRYKEKQNVKECQLEQILEKQRADERQRNLDKYWQLVQQTNLDREDLRQTNENCLKRKLAQQTKDVLDAQVEELECKRDELRREKEEEIARIAQIVEELRLDDFDRHHLPPSQEKIKWRKEMVAELEQRRQQRCAEEQVKADEHRQMCVEMQRLEAEDKAAAAARKKAMHTAMVDYIAYVKRMRQFENSQQDKRDDRIDELMRVDICTKKNIQRELKRKAEVAAACHAELKRQMCEQYERRMREEQERKECKILENRFVKPEITREQIQKQRLQNRKDLDDQIVELNRIRRLEEQQYQQDLKRAIDDPEFCAQLADQYIRDGTDYLMPHANWRLLACPTKVYVPKTMQPYPKCDDLPPAEGTTTVPCGCALRRCSEGKGDGI